MASDLSPKLYLSASEDAKLLLFINPNKKEKKKRVLRYFAFVKLIALEEINALSN